MITVIIQLTDPHYDENIYFVFFFEKIIGPYMLNWNSLPDRIYSYVRQHVYIRTDEY
jgi:hypothetical protein